MVEKTAHGLTCNWRVCVTEVMVCYQFIIESADHKNVHV